MIYVVFVEPESPGNIGFLARTMKNFGLTNLVLINPCELKNESYFQAMHARDVVSNSVTYDSLRKFLKSMLKLTRPLGLQVLQVEVIM